ncbi:Major facilitator superfamily domain-containing protein 2B [Chelonia mydas]|uniref:Major facilitator superfamily domain-containing protein 2B n=1 Tax=Chelonia mydas TaxID=8469 RepID=M7C1H9_CHEMY|nr:Major facilitator superfamily domain-containing protein 2B [Chelonia mydas]
MEDKEPVTGSSSMKDVDKIGTLKEEWMCKQGTDDQIPNGTEQSCEFFVDNLFEEAQKVGAICMTPTKVKNEADIIIKLWKNGFTVNDGELRSYKDVTNQQFLDSVKKGELPIELQKTFDEVDVNVEDKKDEVYVLKKPIFHPFSGQGYRLGSATPRIISKVKKDLEAENKRPLPSVTLSDLEPVTNIQIWLADGERIVQKFNVSHRSNSADRENTHAKFQPAGTIFDGPVARKQLRQEDRLSVCSKLCYAIGGAPNQVATSATAFFLQIYLLDVAHIQTNTAATLKPVFVLNLFQVPYSALTMFLSPDQKERDSATAYRMTVEVLGTLMGAALHGQIVASAHASDHCTVNLTINAADSSSSLSNASNLAESLGLQSHGRELYMIAAGVIGGVYLFGILILFIGVKERDDPYALNSDKAIPFFKGLRLTMKHGPYLKLTASFLLISTAIQLEQSNFVLFCTHAASLHNHFQYLVVTILWMIPFAVMLVTIPNLVLAYVVAFVSGLSIAASLLLPWSMLPDVVDHFRLLNPHAKGPETIFYASYVFFTKMSAGIGLGISTASLEFAGYKTGMCRQSSTVILTLKILIGAVPAILIVIGLSILLFYPITEKSRKETEFALELLRSTNSRKLRLEQDLKHALKDNHYRLDQTNRESEFQSMCEA